MKKQIALVVALAAVVLSLSSCGRKPDPLLNVTEVKAISLVGADGNVRATLAEADKLEIARYVSLVEFDAKFNAGADAVRMASPDYSLVFSYKTPGDTDETVNIWIASGRTLLRSQWYNLRARDLPKAAAILKKY